MAGLCSICPWSVVPAKRPFCTWIFPRTATVSALTNVKLYSLEKEPFLEVLTGHPAAHLSAQAVVAERLATTKTER